MKTNKSNYIAYDNLIYSYYYMVFYFSDKKINHTTKVSQFFFLKKSF